jgi:hypothetical protein
MGTARTTKNEEGIETEIELATGAVAGAAAGAIAGPVGAVVGAGLGTAAGVLAHEARAREVKIRAARDRTLDATIGVSGGSLGADTSVGFVNPPGPAAYLRGDHDELEALAARALAIVEEGDSEEVRALLASIEKRLCEHMEGEERDLVPRYAEEHPDDAAAVLADHAEFRRIFDELAIAGDLHLVRLERVKELLDRLKAHAKRENAGLYRWAAARAERL